MEKTQEEKKLDIKELPPVKWLLDNQKYIAWAFYALLIAGGGYWLHQLVVIDVSTDGTVPFTTEDTKDALVLMIFGLVGVFVVALVAVFLLKLIYNLYVEGIQSIFPYLSDSIVKSTTCLAILLVAFLGIEHVKAAGLTAYKQVTVVLNVATQHDEVTVEGYKKKLEMEQRVRNGDFSDFFKN